MKSRRETALPHPRLRFPDDATIPRRDRRAFIVEELPEDPIEAIADAEPAPEAGLHDHGLD